MDRPRRRKLSGPSPETAERLRRVYQTCREHFGYEPTWWPGSPIELTITAVLVQQCDWSVAWEAAKRLRQAGLLDLPRLAAADDAAVRELVYPVAFYRQKSARLVRIARELTGQGYQTIEDLLAGGATEHVRRTLRELPGIGPETADSVLLFASDRHETFVVDAYARRLFQRLAVFDGCDDGFWQQPYEPLRRFFLEHVTGFASLYADLPLADGVPRNVALLRDFHAQIVELGRHHCRHTNPRCTRRGWPGWTDPDGHFVFCHGHCSNNGCPHCPLLPQCVAGGGNDVR